MTHNLAFSVKSRRTTMPSGKTHAQSTSSGGTTIVWRFLRQGLWLAELGVGFLFGGLMFFGPRNAQRVCSLDF